MLGVRVVVPQKLQTKVLEELQRSPWYSKDEMLGTVILLVESRRLRY